MFFSKGSNNLHFYSLVRNQFSHVFFFLLILQIRYQLLQPRNLLTLVKAHSCRKGKDNELLV